MQRVKLKLMISTEYHSKISRLFSIAANDIKIHNIGFNYYNVNKFAENCIARIFSKIYGVEFIVLEDIDVNFPAVDIGAVDGSIYVQITSEAKARKIKKTLTTIVNNRLESKYEKLQIMFLVSSYNSNLTEDNIIKHLLNETGESYTLDSIGFDLNESLLDFTDLAALIRSKVFKVETLHEIYEILEQEYQYYRYAIDAVTNLPYESIASTINDVLQNKSLKESLLYLADFYYPALVIPPDLIKEIYPFSTDKNLFVENYSLTLSEQNIFEEFRNILEEPQKNNWDDDSKKITRFLRYNGVAFIRFYGKRDVQTVPIYQHTEECDCERCNFEKLNISKVLEKLMVVRANRQFQHIEYPLRVVYTAVQVGDYILAKDLCEYCIVNGDKNRRIEQFIFERNLYNICKKLNITPSFDNERDIVSPDNLIASYTYQGAEKESSAILKWLNSEEYISNSTIEIQGIEIKAKDDSISDAYGHPPSFSYSFELSKAFNLPIRVHWGNLFPDFDSKGYHHFLISSISAFFEIHSVNFKNFSDIDIDSYLKIWIRDLPTPLIRNFLYSIPGKSIKRDFIKNRNVPLRFINRLKGLSQSIDDVKRYVSTTGASRIKELMIRIFNNSLFFARKIELNNDEYKVILTSIGDAIKDHPKFLKDIVSNFCFLVHIRFESFSISNKQKAESLYLEVPIIREYQRTSNFKKYGSSLEHFQSNYEDELDFIEQSLRKNGMGYELNSLFEDMEYLKSDQLNRFQNLLIAALKKRSTPLLIYEGVINNLIQLKDYKLKYIEETLDSRKDKYISYRDKNNQDFDRLVAMHFHSETSISEIEKYSPDSEYYKWLLNISSYNYVNFEHKWILRNQSIPFLEEYKRHPVLIQNIIDQQKTKMIEGVSWVMFSSILA